jgi:hypothetical protein
MRDNRTYGFSKADADDLIAGIGSGESTFPEQKPRAVNGSGGGPAFRLFGFQLKDTITQSQTGVTADIYSLEEGDFIGVVDADVTLYDPAKWYGTAVSGTRGLCFLQDGFYYALQSGCGPG